MRKLEWQQHMKAGGPHDTASCPECAKRRRTKRANAARLEKDQAMRDLGLVKVRVLGGTLWE